MDLLNIGSSGISALIGGTAGLIASLGKDLLVELSRSKAAERIERLKGHLSHNSQITRTQFDIELEAYKELWATIGDVRNSARALLSQEKFVMVVKPENELAYRRESFVEAMKKFHTAHNEAVTATERLAPFYPDQIKKAFRRVTTMNMDIINFYAVVNSDTFSMAWFADLEAKIEGLRKLIDTVEGLIRERLTGVRVMG